MKTDALLFGNVDALEWAGPATGFAAWAERMEAPRLVVRCAKLRKAAAGE